MSSRATAIVISDSEDSGSEDSQRSYSDYSSSSDESEEDVWEEINYALVFGKFPPKKK
jgi:hypothetical protein